jgi:hypothetical protein
MILLGRSVIAPLVLDASLGPAVFGRTTRECVRLLGARLTAVRHGSCDLGNLS